MARDSDAEEGLGERSEPEAEEQSLQFRRVFEKHERSILNKMRYEERSEKPEDRSQNEPKVKPGSTPNIGWPRLLYDRYGWIRNPVEPSIPPKEYALLIVAWAADDPLRWKDITAGIDAHYSRLNDSLRALQGKGYVRKATEPGDEPKLYEITEEGRQVLLREKELDKAVEKGRMGSKHRGMMMEEHKWYLLKGNHVRPDFHTGDDVPDLIVTPIAGGIRYDLKHQWAAECEVEPPRNPGKIASHFKRNRNRGWPTVWISYLERHEDKLKSILREAGGVVINFPSWDESFHYNFSHPVEVIVTHLYGGEIWIEDLVELMENSRAATVAAREGKTIYIRRGRAKTYDPSTQKVEHIGNVDNYARMAKEEDDPAELDEIIRAIDRDIESVKIMGKLLEVLTDDSDVRIGRDFIWSGGKKVCKKNKLVWDDETREFLRASDLLARLKNRKQKAEREGKKWKSYFGYPT